MGLFAKGSKPKALKTCKFSLGDDHINLRELSSKELVSIQADMGDKPTSNMEFVYKLIALCVLDDDGKPIFTDADDVRNNFDIGVSAFREIQEKIMSLSGIDAPKN